MNASDFFYYTFFSRTVLKKSEKTRYVISIPGLQIFRDQPLFLSDKTLLQHFPFTTAMLCLNGVEGDGACHKKG